MCIVPYQFVDFVINIDLPEDLLNDRYDWCCFIL